MKTIAIVVYLACLTLMSVVTFAVYGWDKRQSRMVGWRIPESRLHWLAILGGWPGAMIGQSVVRHKTRKLIFRLMPWAAAILHMAGICVVVLLWQQR